MIYIIDIKQLCLAKSGSWASCRHARNDGPASMPKRTFIGPNSLISVKELDVRGTVWCSATLGCDNTAVGELEALNRIAPYVRRIALISIRRPRRPLFTCRRSRPRPCHSPWRFIRTLFLIPRRSSLPWARIEPEPGDGLVFLPNRFVTAHRHENGLRAWL